MKVFSSISRKIKNIEPVHWMIIGVAVVVGLIFSFQYISAPATNLTVVYDDLPETSKAAVRKKYKEAAQMGETDQNMRLSARVVEASGIVNALLVYSLAQHFVENKGVPANASDLLNGFQDSELRPPFVQKINSSGHIITARGAYFVTYNAKPLTVSLLASGDDYKRDGAIFVLRAPDETARYYADREKIKSAAYASLFVAPEQSDGAIPAPFALAQDFLRAGWSVEPLRLNDISSDKLDAVNQMLDKYGDAK